jgi:uncharacterized membrane protein
MSGTEVGLALSVFLACTVEAVEALTIVLAVGTTRSWASALGGAGSSILVLAAIVVALGPGLTRLPIDVLRAAIGGLLLVFGLQWLRKAILRAGGLKPKHDERQIYRQELDAAREAGTHLSGFDGYAFAVSFKGVLLEGLEVAFIVLTFGANQHRVALAGAAAGIAVLVVVAAGVAARAPLARVPENTMKFAVGVMLSSFGMFWGTEGVGASWPGGEAALPVIVCGLLLAALIMARRTSVAGQTASPVAKAHAATRAGTPARNPAMPWMRGTVLDVWEFVVGDDWATAIGVVLALTLTALIASAGGSAWWVMALTVLGLLARSISRELNSVTV